MAKLDATRVLVTGASSGIGALTAEKLAAAGADVALLSRSEEGLQEVAERVRARGARAVVVPADVTDREELTAAVEQAVDELGGLDALVLNHGAAVYGAFTHTDPDDVQRTLEVTLLGGVHVVRAVLPHLERSAGTIVATGSVAGRMPLPLMAAYAAAKHGLRGFLETLRLELRAQGSPVRVGIVHPGPVDTPFWNNAKPADDMPPQLPFTYDPETVADALVDAVARPRPERTLGLAMKAASLLHGVARPLFDVGMVAATRWAMGREESFEPGNAIWEPSGEARVRSK